MLPRIGRQNAGELIADLNGILIYLLSLVLNMLDTNVVDNALNQLWVQESENTPEELSVDFCILL